MMDCYSMANSLDDRKSATWICFNLSLATMSWASRKQKCWIRPWYIVMIRAIWSLQEKTSVPCQTEVHWDQALYSPWWSPEKRSGSLIYLRKWATNRYFGKASVQDENFEYSKKQDGACGGEFLIEKGSDYSQVGREHWYVIDLWTIIFQFE